jgi:zinc protease
MPDHAMTGTELLERIEPVEHRLDNGLTLLVRPERAAPVAAVVTYVRAGYFDEPDRWVGISHVLEHMYFKGTPTRGPGEIARATKAVGGYLNAGTIYDHTSYYAVLPAAALERGLEIQADALIRSTINAEELAKELVVIIEEVKRKRDNPGAMASEKLYEAMFDRHPMRRWRMGTEEELSRLTRDDVVAYYRDRYRAGNIVLVVAGDVDPDQVIRRAAELYAAVSPGAPETDPEGRAEPVRASPRVREMSGDITQTYAGLGWRTPGTLHPDTPTLDALALVAGQGRASRLYRGVRERGLASSVHAYNYTPTEIGVFGVSLECEPERTAEALRAAWSELANLAATPVAAHELERVRTLLRARLLRRLETAEGQANLLAEWHALDHWRSVGDYVDRISDLEPADLQAAAERYLDPERTTLLVYRPAAAPALGWDDARLTARLGDDAPPALPAPEPAPVASAAEPGGAPSLLLGPARRDDGVVQHDLDSGRLVVKRRPHAPLVSMAILRSGGATRETVATAGVAGLVMRASLKGTAALSADQVSAASERLGGSIGAVAGSDILSWSLTVPSDQFDEGFALLADVASNPVFPDQEVAKERAMMLADLDRLRDDMYRYPLRLLLSAAFGHHPYGFSVEQVEVGLAQLESEDLRRWHARELGEPWVVVVGDVEPERVAEAVARRLPAPNYDGSRPGPAPKWPHGPQVLEVQRDREQTAMAVAFPGPSRTHPDRIPLDVLSSAISGLGNRLFEELRSRRSLAYTVTAYPISRRLGGAFVGYLATSTARAEEARTALVEELTRLRQEPPSEEELERARRYTIGSRQIQTQSNAAQLSELAGALMIGEGLAEIREFDERVMAVSRDQALAVAQRWIDPDRLVEGVVRGGGTSGDVASEA